MPRKLRHQEPGATYHVTTHGVSELLVLPDDATKTRFLELVAGVAARNGWRVRAYCLLTSHYHLLVTTPQGNIAAGMQELNGRYARWLNRASGRRGHVWEARYHGEPIQTDSHLLECIRYIALNPVRAGLVRAPARWAWSSYASLVDLASPLSFVDSAAVLALFGATRTVAAAQLRGFVEIAARPDADGLRLR
jgi:REP element-mobilizing transposase RayT